MAEITAKLVKELREKSGAGVMDAKKALVEVDGDIEKAIELLREKGMAKAAKKADRVAAEGLTGVYVNGNVAAIVEVNSETDFVAKNAQFVELVNETAKVIAEGKPANNDVSTICVVSVVTPWKTSDKFFNFAPNTSPMA